MTKRMFRTFWSILTLLALLLLFAPWALADVGPVTSGTDEIRVSEDGTVTLLSGHIAGEGVSSLQMKLEIPEGEAGFTFSDSISAVYMTKVSAVEGGLNLYIAGTKPLMSAGQTELVLGTVSGAAPEGVKLAAGSPQYVYGTRLIGHNLAEEDGPLENAARSALRSEVEFAGVFEQESVQALYTKDSIQTLLDAVSKATELLDDTGASDEDLQAALERLQAARQGLLTVAAGELEQHVADALAKVEQGSYTPESLENLERAIEDAAKARKSGDDAWVQRATEALQEALNKLVPAVMADSNGRMYADGALDSMADGQPSSDGTAAAAPTATAASGSGQTTAPDTGDGSAPLLWAGLLVLSSALLTAVIRRRAHSGR